MLFLTYTGFTQQQSTLFHSAFDPYLINPAYAGEADGQNLYLIGRNDFLNMPDAPKSYHLTFDAALSNPRIGFGAQAFSNSMFAVKNLGFSASYRYKFQIAERHFLSTALSAGFVQNSLDFSKIIANDPSDISDFIGTESTMRPNFHVGFLYQFADLKIGASAFHALSPSFVYEKSQNQQDLAYRLLQQYHASVSYKLRFGNRWAVDMMALGGGAHGLPFWGTFNATFIYDDMFWFGGGYGYQTLSYVTAGIRLAEQLVLSYSYGFSTESYRTQLGASHEISLGYRIQRTTSRGRDHRLSQEITQLQFIVENQGEEIDRLKQERLELRKQMQQLQFSQDIIDSLKNLVHTAVADAFTQNQKVEEPEILTDTTEKYVYEDRFYVIIAAAPTIENVKKFQQLVLRNFRLETKVLDPTSSHSHFFIYTDVFNTQREAVNAMRQLERTDIGDYIIGNIWIHQAKEKVIEEK
jgi:type IX secretion system PorP/SprF family membrane protein